MERTEQERVEQGQGGSGGRDTAQGKEERRQKERNEVEGGRGGRAKAHLFNLHIFRVSLSFNQLHLISKLKRKGMTLC